MSFSVFFFINSVLLGIGLAMDAFSVSIANGLNEPKMRVRKACLIALTFAVFQFAMPMIGWICVHTVVVYFSAFQKFIPWIALLLLGFIGGKMVLESSVELARSKKCKNCNNENCTGRKYKFVENTKKKIISECESKEKVSEKKSLGFGLLMVQGIATSIDALSVGFTISDYNWLMALIAALIIGLETFGICIAGLKIGRKIGEKIEGSAQIIGGLILIGIGVEIFVKGVFFGS